jgi:hypothetical protein
VRGPQKQTVRQRAWSWPVAGSVVLFIFAAGVTFTTSDHTWLADLFYLAGDALFLARFFTWGEARGPRVRLLVAAIAVVATLGMVLGNHYLNRRGPDIIAKRADVRVRQIEIRMLGEGGLPMLNVHFENVGSLRAEVKSYYSVYTTKRKDTIELEDQIFQKMLDDTKGLDVPTYDVPAGSKRYMHYKGTRPVSPEQQDQLRSGRLSMYFVGRLVYHDALGWQAFEYCSYLKNEPRVFSCMRHNGPATP